MWMHCVQPDKYQYTVSHKKNKNTSTQYLRAENQQSYLYNHEG